MEDEVATGAEGVEVDVAEDITVVRAEDEGVKAAFPPAADPKLVASADCAVESPTKIKWILLWARLLEVVLE